MPSKPSPICRVSFGHVFSLCIVSYLLGLVLLSSPGCNDSVEQRVVDEQNEAPTVELTETDYDTFQTWLKSKKGNVVLVDYWATYCAPCLKKFPKVVKLHKELKQKGLAVCSVSIDELKKDQEKTLKKVEDKLVELDATFDNFIATGPIIENFEKHQLSLVPTYKVFDKEGNLVKKFEGEFEFKDVEKLIKEQLEK